MEFLYTARFLKSLKKLPNLVTDDVYQAVEEFKKKTNHTRLKLHKLQGRMKKYHVFSANYEYRIIIEIKNKEVIFIDVGNHSMYE